jgi:hypothetical protein
MYTVKKVIVFPVTSRDVSLAGYYSIKLFPGQGEFV